VSKDVVSLIQGLVLLFVAAPALLRWLLRLKSAAAGEPEASPRGGVDDGEVA
jgi:ABC-type uncharacterized transport system permease subunit